MYERNAIVLERYFDKVFDFNNSSNLRKNYQNYRKLFECYGTLFDAKERELNCQKEYEDALKEIERLQKTQEKLYNRSAKYEYSRYIIFSNVEEAPDTIQKHLQKVSEDAKKNVEELEELGEKFAEAVRDCNEKEKNLKEARGQRAEAQEEYDRAFMEAQSCYIDITDEYRERLKYFIDSDNKEMRKELQEIFDENGKNERNPFDPSVISNTINKSMEIYKQEIDIYLAGFDRITKLFEEIEDNSIKTEKHTKYYKDSKAKLDFLLAEKEYIVQFLDNERIGAIYDKKSHRKLMLEACKKFTIDFEQIDKLFEIILKEVAGRYTKKIYKENYNKEYLLELESVSVEPALDTGIMRQEAIAFMNLNYWRIEGLRKVYSVFEETVTTIYERDLSEFEPVIEIPEEVPEMIEESNIEQNSDNQNIIESEEIAEKIEEAEELPEEQYHTEENVLESEEKFDDNEIGDELLDIVHEIIAEQDEKKVPEVIEEKNSDKKTSKSLRVYHSSKKALANAIYYSLQLDEVPKKKKETIQEEIEEEPYSLPEKASKILASFEKEDLNIIDDDFEFSKPSKEMELPTVEFQEEEPKQELVFNDEFDEEYFNSEYEEEKIDIEDDEDEPEERIELDTTVEDDDTIELDIEDEFDVDDFEEDENEVEFEENEIEDDYEENEIKIDDSYDEDADDDVEFNNDYEEDDSETDDVIEEKEVEIDDDDYEEEEVEENKIAAFTQESEVNTKVQEFDLSTLDEIEDEVIEQPKKIEKLEEHIPEKIENIIPVERNYFGKLEEDESEEYEEAEPIITQFHTEDNITEEDLVDDEEYDEEEDSILEIYFSEDEDASKTAKNNVNVDIDKKVGFFKKLVGYNAKRRKEA